MNEVASTHSFEVAMWIIGSLFTVFTLLVAAIHKNGERRHEQHESELKWMRENFVSKDTLARVERTFADAVDDMTAQRRENQEEARRQMQEIKEAVTGIHRRIDEEFRFIRNNVK